MCTVSFIPNAQGFYLAMNRDELLTRVAGLPPCVFERDGYRAIYPREPSGGTWIAVNEGGICLTITNWHRVDCVPPGSLISRGEVVKSLALASSLSEVEKGLQDLPLSHMRAFRLFAIASHEQSVREYCWDVRRLQHHRWSWTRRHWFSSGYDEPMAEHMRARVCEQAWHKSGAGSLGWLRYLHATHSPEPGPFSICMHQAVAETVSYTEIVLKDKQMTMRYQPGAPCSSGTVYEATLHAGRTVVGD
ncbi:MAG TPA: NRDE family protein [Chthoniobacterales bacterium]